MELGLSDPHHATLTLSHGERQVTLRAAALNVPYPSALTALLAREPDVEVVVVERAPPGLAAEAERLNIGYLDAHGRGRVVRDGFVYVAEPLAAPIARSRTSPFARRASRVVRALLSDHLQHWRISDLALLVGLNPGNVHRVLAALVERGYVEREHEWYLVADPGSLLEAWAEVAVRPRPEQRAAIPYEGDLRAAVRHLVEQLGGDAVVSGELAAELLAPHLPAAGAIVHCLDADAWERLDPELLGGDGLAKVAPHPYVIADLVDEGVADFGSRADGLRLVGPVQLYVDMARAIGRGREAAEAVRRQRLGY